MLLSVVTITFNNFAELEATVESVRGVADVELVIVNGGSCKETQKYLETLALPGTKIKTLTERDHGISDAFNKGIRLATGDAIVFLNSGDTLRDRDYFGRAMGYLERHPEVGFVHGSIAFTDKIAGTIELKPSLSSLGRGMPYRHQTMIVRHAIFDQLGHFRTDLKITMDYDFVCRMQKAGVIGYYDQTGPLVLMDGGGVSSTKELAAYAEGFHVLREHGLLTAHNMYGTAIRYGTYFVRATLVRLGLTSVLAKLKELKHGRPTG